MKKTAVFSTFFLVAAACSVLFSSCYKHNDYNYYNHGSTTPDGKQNIAIYLTGAPPLFNQISLDARSVQVEIDTCSTGNQYNGQGYNSCYFWDSLAFSPSIYNLANGSDALLASSTVPAGNITSIRIKLGPNNSLVKDSVNYPLQLLPNADSEIVLNVDPNQWDRSNPDSVRLWIDLDAQPSVVASQNNGFYLAPSTQIFSIAPTGSISGNVLPAAASAVISVYNNSDTAYAVPSRSGGFDATGLMPGAYSIFINASNGYADTTITNVDVTMGSNVSIGNITLHQ